MDKKEKTLQRVRKYRSIRSSMEKISGSCDISIKTKELHNADTSSAAISDDLVHQNINDNEQFNGDNLECEDRGNSSCINLECSNDYSIIDQEDGEIEELRNWAISCNIPLAHLDKLLCILRKRVLPKLPKTGKTFLQTTKAAYSIRPMMAADNSLGEFVYLGIEKSLANCIDPNVHVNSNILLQIHVDGASPYNSGTKQLWPILCKVLFQPDIYNPFVVALYCGDKKPKDVDQFTFDFIEEINLLHKNGIHIDDKKYSVELKHIICDIPARKFLKQVKGHGGYAACERCNVYGKCVGFPNQRVVYPDSNCQLRTDHSFRKQENPEHHTGLSPLLRIEPPIDMIKSFPLDYMHLCCLGITKKFYIMDLIFTRTAVRLDVNLRQKLFNRIDYLRSFIPCEFQRKIRRPVPNLKASELRFIAVYAGPILFKDIMSTELYQHFLLFHTALRILLTKGLAQRFNSYAKSYLTAFFESLPIFYGEECHVLNAHYLLLLAEDVQSNNYTLNDLSAFPFESQIGFIKRLLHSAKNPLAQICRRIHERNLITKKPVIPSMLTILKEKKLKNNHKLLLKLRYKNFTLTAQSPNNIIMLNNGTIVKITNLRYKLSTLNAIQITGFKWGKKGAIFNYPTNSTDLNIWELNKKVSQNAVTFKLKDINLKMIKMHVPYLKNNKKSEKIYVLPLLH